MMEVANSLAPFTRLMLFAGILGAAAPAWAEGEEVPFDSDRWVRTDASVVDYLGRRCLMGTARLKDMAFENGVIEVDLAVDDVRQRSYSGIAFRMQSDRDFEHVYVRPHSSQLLPNVLQYAPVFNGVAGWQLYSGEGFTAPAVIPEKQWIPMKLVIGGTQARVYLNHADEPALVIPRLKHGLSRGTIGVVGRTDGLTYLSNFRYRLDDTITFDEPPELETPSGTIRDWQISRAYGTDEIDTEAYPQKFTTFFEAQWRSVQSEPSGLVDIARYVPRRPDRADCVFARAVVRSSGKRTVKLSFGYSDDVTVLLNQTPLFTGHSGYRSRDPGFAGIVGLHDAVYLPLEKGNNEIVLIVTERFGGWGFMGRTERELPGALTRHDAASKVWETDAVFAIPESVLYDAERNVLYVTNYDKFDFNRVDTGFISRVTLDGEIQDLKWVTGLDGPCGMALHGDRLFVTEGPRQCLVEIDIGRGEVINRHQFADGRFLNDVVVDGSGYVYVSNSSGAPKDHDIFRFKDGRTEIWKTGEDIHRSNGLCLRGDELIVGNSGDGLLKSVNIKDGKVTVITSLGGGIIDGIRVDNDGNYLVSHWTGQTYRISPDGEVTEILDTQEEGLNTADFEFVNDRDLLVIPTFFGNKVVAYRVTRE